MFKLEVKKKKAMDDSSTSAECHLITNAFWLNDSIVKYDRLFPRSLQTSVSVFICKIFHDHNFMITKISIKKHLK